MKKLRIVAILAVIVMTALLATRIRLAPVVTVESGDLPGSQEPFVRIFADIHSMDGESTETNHLNWIHIESFDFYTNQPGSGIEGISRQRSEAEFDDIILTKSVDKTTPKLMEKVARGQVIELVTIEFTRYYDEVSQIFYKYELENVMITSFQSTGVQGAYPIDTFTLNFETIKVTYTEYDEYGATQGNVEWEWDVETGEA